MKSFDLIMTAIQEGNLHPLTIMIPSLQPIGTTCMSPVILLKVLLCFAGASTIGWSLAWDRTETNRRQDRLTSDRSELIKPKALADSLVSE